MFNIIIKFVFFIVFVTDGYSNEEDFRGWIVGSNNTGGCQELLRAIWAGKYKFIIFITKLKISTNFLIYYTL
jgi:hypothetical protein